MNLGNIIPAIPGTGSHSLDERGQGKMMIPHRHPASPIKGEEPSREGLPRSLAPGFRRRRVYIFSQTSMSRKLTTNYENAPGQSHFLTNPHESGAHNEL
jgi:hypothetical protein